MRDAVIFDMDGTLVNVEGIRHLVEQTPKRFDDFHEQSVDAPPNSSVVNHAQVAKMLGLDVIVVTARRSKWRNHTAFWLAMHDVPSDALLMRHDKDGRSDALVKADILRQIRKCWRVVHAVDDNPAIIELWESEGIPVTVVPGWNTAATT